MTPTSISPADTICALATAPGGAIGIIRISGPGAITIADSIFTPKGGTATLAARKANTVTFGTVADTDGTVIDEVLASIFRSPHSYTGEDCVELSCHGSRYILSRVLQRLTDSGCRQARPGEYTQRAFLNGKMDLSQAEAVADLIAATNRATHHMAIGQLRGNFSGELSDLRGQLLRLTSLLELELDFSDHEELEFADRTELLEISQAIERRIATLAQSFKTGQAVKQGIPVAIIGKTNVGKSTLLNLLAGEEKAIVSDIHGTTRDVIEDTIDIGGVAFRLTDTAGIRHTGDRIELLGIERTYRKMAEAAITLWMVDALPSQDETADITSHSSNGSLIVVNNKTDLADLTPTLRQLLPQTPVVAISARQAKGIEQLKSALLTAANIPPFRENDVVVTSARHYQALLLGQESIARVISGLHDGTPSDLISEDLRLCLHHLAEITGGEISSKETLENIFKKFCVGK